MEDSSKREYLKIADAKQGLVELDNGFTCRCGGPTMLYANEDGALYFYCDAGKHDLSGQAEGDHYIGIYPCTSIRP